MSTMTELFGEPISVYTRAQAIADGMLVDAHLGDLDEVTTQHCDRTPVAMTNGLFALIEKSVKNPKYGTDWKGIWHDILWMSSGARRQLAKTTANGDLGTGWFRVIIVGTGRRQTHLLKVVLGPDDHWNACWTYMLQDED